MSGPMPVGVTPENTTRSVSRVDHFANIPLPTAARALASAVLIAFALATPGFTTVPSLTSLLTGISFVGLVACGMTLITISGNIMSFSLGVTVAAATVIFAIAYNSAGLPTAVAATFVSAAIISGLQGLMIGGFRANPIIVSIAALALIHGILQALTAGISVYIPPDSTLELLKGKIVGLPLEFITLLVLAGFGQFMLGFTVFGRNLFMVGDGPAAAEALGIRNWRTITGAYVLAGLFCAVPAILLAARFGSGSMAYGQGYDYSAIAAILIGGTAIQGGRGSILQTCFGVAFIALVQTLLVLHGAREEWQVFGLGVMVFVVIMLQTHGDAGGSAAATTAVLRVRDPHLRALILLALTILGMMLLDIGHGRFLAKATAFTALQQFATLGPVALGLGLTMIIREFDLSVAGMFGMAGCVAVLTGVEYPALGLGAAVAVGAIGGAAQGLLITRLGLGSVSVTLAGLLLFVGVAYVLTQSHSIGYDNIDFALVIDAPVIGVFSVRSLVAIGVFAVGAICVSTTRVGRDMIAMGSDRRAAIFAGVNVDRLLIGTFSLSGMLAALAGALLSFGLASASPSGLSDVLVPATAAAILGGVSLSGGVGRPLGIAAGVLSLAILRSGLNGLGASPAVHDIVTGAILLGVAVIDGGTCARYLAKFRATTQMRCDEATAIVATGPNQSAARNIR
jgi:ribose/xylose/arabinose/galactoside ABC-type transport system permease subunit